ncbi:hypothetical protein CBS9595_000786 [Malassezia furfur]|nr:hypothetical protein CBS9595_000786 [Malassezia furfur]
MGARAYTRDPREAERLAGTVAGHRAERARRERLQREADPVHSRRRRGSKFSRAWRVWNETPLKWTPLPVLLGAIVLVGVQAHRQWEHNHRIEPVVDASGEPVRTRGPWSLYVLGALPLNSISRSWGWMNSHTLPVWFRPYGFRLYSWVFGCNLDEMLDPDLTHYESLGQFFSRELKPGVRPLADSLVVSPCDGTVLHLGEIEGDRVEQVKGITYSLDSLLGYNKRALTHELVPGREEHEFCTADEQQFASLNGIDYSLGDLLGDQTKQRKSVRNYLLGWAKGSWRYVRQTASSLRPWGASRSTNGTAPAGLDEEADPGDAGIPTSDTPENLQHVANVAYEMGSEAIPTFMREQAISPEKLRPGHRLYFCVIYLAPGDYHRFHSPVPWVVEMRRHFRGELYSVSPYVARRLPNLFLLNERVALLGRWRYGFFSMTPIGATNVGSIRINFDRNLRTNVRGQRKLMGTYSEATYNAASRILGGQPLATGEEVGGFLLGSTIVLVFEAPESFHFEAKPGDKVKMGQAMGDLGKAA